MFKEDGFRAAQVAYGKEPPYKQLWTSLCQKISSKKCENPLSMLFEVPHDRRVKELVSSPWVSKSWQLNSKQYTTLDEAVSSAYGF